MCIRAFLQGLVITPTKDGLMYMGTYGGKEGIPAMKGEISPFGHYMIDVRFLPVSFFAELYLSLSNIPSLLDGFKLYSLTGTQNRPFLCGIMRQHLRFSL